MDDFGSFTDPAIQRCPFGMIRRLHAEAPIYLDPGTGFYVVSRYQDITYISDHPELFSNKTDVILGSGSDPAGAAKIDRLYAETGFPRIHTLVTNDPPSHGHFRAIVDKVFTPSFVRQMEPDIAELVDELIDDIIEHGQADLLHAFCLKLPMFVICDQLGIPRTQWLTFKSWSDASIGLINPALEYDERLRLSTLHIAMQNYLAQRRSHLLAHPDDGMLSRLAYADVQGERLTAQEFVNVADQLLVAGNETTTSGIAHAAEMLMQRPDLKRTLIETPAKIGSFVEEVLRIHAPSPHLYREALQAATIGGVTIPAGRILMLSYLAGNYDPARFGDAEQVDLNRTGIRNHLAFGRGIHYCIGNLLARAEMRAAVAGLLRRMPDIALRADRPAPRIAASYHVHTLENLDVAFTPRPRQRPALSSAAPALEHS